MVCGGPNTILSISKEFSLKHVDYATMLYAYSSFPQSIAEEYYPIRITSLELQRLRHSYLYRYDEVWAADADLPPARPSLQLTIQ
ncbi:unnamed protein product [Fusarium graminearum]|uniref:Uncharacterized protein n=1 Tax=Gibberella zeae TaxID=5518 RepID=A0A9N8RDG3_GIBZA|nr:unnamed protein product [Fusarium graminearum]